jgi:hypothetical protein
VPYADLQNPQSLNLYGYVQNNPLTNTDPNGHWCLFGKLGTTCKEDAAAQQPPPPPAPPPTPAVITPGTPQNDLANAQDKARTDPKFAPVPNGPTYCNLATCSILKTYGGPLDGSLTTNGIPNMANTDVKTLANSPNWREVSPEEAQNLANQGVPVVASQGSPGPHGHIATVRPELLPGTQAQLGQGPLINNIGRHLNVTSAGGLYGAFAHDQPIKYYAPAK